MSMKMLPMLAHSLESPDSLDTNSYIQEPKFDGVRCISILTPSSHQLLNRNGVDITSRYPELKARTFKHSFIFDGEIIAKNGTTKDFQELQQRNHLYNSTRIKLLAREKPVRYILFDLLKMDDDEIVDWTLTKRKMLLEAASKLINNKLYIKCPFRTVDFHIQEEMEGVMLKEKTSRYYLGARKSAWLKYKQNHTIDAWVIGYNEGEGERANTFGSLQLALKDGTYIGDVGSGFSQRELEDIKERMDRGERVVVEVKYLCWSKGGKLRHPVFLKTKNENGSRIDGSNPIF